MNLNQLIKELQDVKRREKENGSLPVIIEFNKPYMVNGVWVNEDCIELIL
ncbi:MAG: hypothetical protein QHH15_00435 [Candidatus Thermoplasmatota archaeon]|nr:hypothetical protein [Candidatus Thermoplasmatota archaeon]MDH7506241.1 hypothetical protein [Candidatus Thermoplasmatota archaeon]